MGRLSQTVIIVISVGSTVAAILILVTVMCCFCYVSEASKNKNYGGALCKNEYGMWKSLTE